MFADEVMASIFHMAQHMEEKLSFHVDLVAAPPHDTIPPINAFGAAGRGLS
jgi:hypothetical protein